MWLRIVSPYALYFTSLVTLALSEFTLWLCRCLIPVKLFLLIYENADTSAFVWVYLSLLWRVRVILL